MTLIGNAEFVRLAHECAPQVAIGTLYGLVRTESGFNPWALSVNYPKKLATGVGVAGRVQLAHQPQSRGEAVRWAAWLTGRGLSVSVGLMQVSTENMRTDKRSIDDVFEPCTNLRVGSSILTIYYQQELRFASGAQSLIRALSRYNSGSRTIGARDGYVDKVAASRR